MARVEAVEVARRALVAFDLPSDAELKPIRFVNNAVFEVAADNARLVLRIHRPGYREVAHIRSELEFLRFLGEELDGTRTQVPRPVAGRTGDLVVEVAAPGGEARACTLLTWVGGRVLKPGRGLGPAATFELGATLARLHRAAERFERSASFEVPVWDADTMFPSASPFRPGRLDEELSPEDWSLFQETAERARALFDVLGREGHPMRVVHHDFVLVNCHLSRLREGWSVGVLDFDDLGWCYLPYELGPILGNFADFPSSYPRLRDAFLAGYRSSRPLATALEVHLPVLMAARHANACVWLVGLHRTTGTGPPFAEHLAYRMDAIRHCLTLR